MIKKLGVCFMTFLTTIIILSGQVQEQPTTPFHTPFIPIAPPIAPVPPAEVYKLGVRVLILKHSHEPMADHDARLAEEAANNAASQGLKITVVGNIDVNDLNHLKKLLDEKMTHDMDTFVVHTIGHGFQSGGLAGLGARSGVLKVIAEAAEAKNQRTLWWQLSCHAAAGLPDLSTLTEKQQKLLTLYCSSPAEETSGTDTQARIMGQVFGAIAKHDKALDLNGDNIIDDEELRQFIDKQQGGRGRLLFSHNRRIFGLVRRQL